MNLFEKASRDKIRFETNKGLVSVEELWDFSLPTLDIIAKSVNKKLKESNEESFIEPKTKGDKELSLKLEILKSIIKTKQAEAELAKVRIKKQEQIKFLKELLVEKQTDKMKGQSIKTIEAQIAELEADEA